MAQALSGPPLDALEWKGEGVTIAQVLDALTEFRRKFAQAQSADDDHPHPRNCVMTLIAVAATEAEEKLAQRICTAIAVASLMARFSSASVAATAISVITVFRGWG